MLSFTGVLEADGPLELPKGPRTVSVERHESAPELAVEPWRWPSPLKRRVVDGEGEVEEEDGFLAEAASLRSGMLGRERGVVDAAAARLMGV